MKKRMINTIRTDALEQRIAWNTFTKNGITATALRDLAHDIGAPIDEDEIKRIVNQYRENERIDNGE